MGDAIADLSAYQARIRQLKGLGEKIAPDAARAWERETAAQVARGEAPDGTPWRKTADGRTPLRGAMKNVTTRAVGTTIIQRVAEHHARHHLGAVRGGKGGRLKRPIISTEELSDGAVKAISAVADRAFLETMGEV